MLDNHPAFCSQCGHRLHPGFAFCAGCGAATSSYAGAAAHGLAAANAPAHGQLVSEALPASPPPPAAPVWTPAAPSGAFAAVVLPAHPVAPAVTVGDPLAKLGEQLRDVPFSTLVPLRAWWGDGVWRRGWLGVFLLFAIAPFLLLRLTEDDADVERIAWGFALYFGFAWALALGALIRPEPQQLWLLVRIAVFTAVAGIAIAIALEERFDPGDSWAAMVFGVGLPEEFAKGLAVWLFVTRFSPVLWSTRTYVFAGAVSGLAFGTAEAVTYASFYEMASPYLSTTEYTSVLVWRLLIGGLFHACMAGIVAYFIGLASMSRQRPALLIGFGVALSAVLHGTYNRFSDDWAGAAVAALIMFVFAGYVRSGDEIADRYRAVEEVRA